MHGPTRRIVRGKGIYVEDDQGNTLIDGIAGLWCANLGHGRPEIAETMSEAARQLDYFHTFGGVSNPAQEKLAARLVDMAPGDLSHAFFGTSGSDANDTIIKIVWHYNNLLGRPEKKKIISRHGAYHGTSISSASLTGLKGFHRDFDLPVSGILHTECPHFYRFRHDDEGEAAFSTRLVTELERLIESEGAQSIAAFIGEPLMGAGGVVPPPEGYWEGVQRVCRKHDILIIADEVVCGFGRTGADFGSDRWSIKPDLMSCAKAITSGVFPFSAVLVTSAIWEVLKRGSEKHGSFSHGYTYSGHPIGAAVANTVLDIYHQEQLAQNAADIGEYFKKSLEDRFADHPAIGEIRGEGLVLAVQLVADRPSRTFFDPKEKLPAKVAEAAYERGLIVRPLPSIGALAFSPPLTVSRDDVDLILNRFEAALYKTLPH